MAEGKKVEAESLKEIKVLNEPQLSPDGSRFAYIEQYITDEDEYTSHLFIQSTVESKATKWSYGKLQVSSPRFSPDGLFLVYLGVKEKGAKPQLYLLPMDGGEARPLTDLEDGASEPIWSPDSSQILFTTPKNIRKQEDKLVDTDEKTKPHVIENLKYKSDAAGFLDEKKKQLALYDLETEELIYLTNEDVDHEPSEFSPDGKKIVYSANKQGDAELVSDLYLLNIASKESTLLTNSKGNYYRASFSPDGSKLAFFGHNKEFLGATHNHIHVLDLNTNEKIVLTKDLDLHAADAANGDLRSGHPSPGPIWSIDGEKIYFTASLKGNTNFYSISMDGRVEAICEGKHHIYGYDVNVNEDVAILSISRPRNPGDAYLVNLRTKEIIKLTFLNENWLNKVHLQQPAEITVKAKDGRDVHGWVLKPYGYEQGKKYPAILEIHGGPHTMYANSFFHQLQLLAAEGYFVFYCNPRGSYGYGQEFVNACRGDYGGMDYEDLMSFTDAVLEKYPDIDKENLGVTGGSYGGFMTNWIVSHTNRFKAAATLRSISNWISFYGVSDIGYFFTDWEVGTNVLKDPEKLWEHSPLKYVNEMETPLLILHGERDFRCPVEQAEQLFVALKHRGKETRFVRFPDANHELSRSGPPHLRYARLEELVNWFNKYLKN